MDWIQKEIQRLYKEVDKLVNKSLLGASKIITIRYFVDSEKYSKYLKYTY